MSTPFLRLGEFAHSPAIEIFNPYVALQDWTGSPGLMCLMLPDVPDVDGPSPVRIIRTATLPADPPLSPAGLECSRPAAPPP